MSVVERAGERLGGQAVLGTDILSNADLFRLVEKGVPPAALDTLIAALSLSAKEVGRYIVSQETINKLKKKNERLSEAVSDRAVRVARIVALAEETFGDVDNARRWLRMPNHTLDEQAPLDLMRTEAGGRLVEDVLYRIAHGIAA